LERPRDVADFLDAVLAARARLALHELQVVDDDEVEAPFGGEAARLGAKLRRRKHWRVVEPDVRLGKNTRSADNAALLELGLLAEAQAGRINARLGREQAHGELLGRHLERKEDDVRSLV